MMKTRVWAGIALFCLFLSGAAAQKAPEVVYVPPEDWEANSRAMDELGKQLKAGGGFSFFIEKPELSVHQQRNYVTGDWKDDRIVLRSVQGSRAPIEFRFDALPKIEVIHDTVLGASFYGVRLSDDWAMWCATSSSSMRLVCGKWLGETFAAARARHAAIVKGRAAFEAKFREALAKYPTSESRPPFPEEARRFKVLAESAVEAKSVEQATSHYTSALQAAPWWVEGYFNVALLYSELKNYDGAIRNMRRFLLLEPNHPKAREAQDQIYRWESQLQSAQK